MNEKHDTCKTQTDLTGVMTEEGASPEALLTRPRTFGEEQGKRRPQTILESFRLDIFGVFLDPPDSHLDIWGV